MTPQEAMSVAARRLERSGVPGAMRDARLLMAAALDLAPGRLLIDAPDSLTSDQQDRFDRFVARREAREPVSRITAQRMFWGRLFQVSPAVLDPRPETETLIVAALDGPQPGALLDLGTGTGIIAISLLCEWAAATAVGVDIDPAGLDIARRNAVRHHVGDRLQTLQSNWFHGVTGMYDLIVSNPPYIARDEMAGLAPEVRDHDPRHALTDEADGLKAYRAIAAGAMAHLNPGGRMIVEIGPTQGQAVADLFRAAGLADVQVLQDLDGRDRVVRGHFPG